MVINSYNTQHPLDYRQSPEFGIIQQINRIGNENILDIGCGTGKQCQVLSANAKKVIGIDLQPFMIEFAIKNNKEDNINYICDDFFNFEIDDDFFDIIISQNVLFHVKNKKEFLKKIYQKLKRGGQFIFTDLTQHNEHESPENLSFPITAPEYSKILNEVGFTNVLFLYEKHWIWDGRFSGKNYSMFKCSK